MITKFDIPRLKLREGTGVYATGKARVLQILEAAYDIVMTQGYAALSLREIARQCGIRVGAISHYYKTKDDLIRDLLESAIAAYQQHAEEILEDNKATAVEKLEAFIILVLEDIRTEKTTKFYPELWALANQNPFVSELLDNNYASQRETLGKLIIGINTSINEHTASLLALYISASLEGMTIFIGYERSQATMFDAMKTISVKNMIDLVRITKDGDFAG